MARRYGATEAGRAAVADYKTGDEMLIVVALVMVRPGCSRDQLVTLLRESEREDENEFYDRLVAGLGASLDAALVLGYLEEYRP